MTTRLSPEVRELGPWLQNLHLPDGTQTAPDHPLGDWPDGLWRSFQDRIPQDLRGQTVLDIGCNAGFYAFEMARRGAHVVGVDPNPRYLRQAQWAARQFGLADRIEFRQAQVYDLAQWDQEFDIVVFLGVLYHLRYPLLGLDIAAQRTRGLLVVQSLLYEGRSEGAPQAQPDVRLEHLEGGLEHLAAPDWPKLAFIEGRLFGDPTNWWVPNAPAMRAMLASTGMEVQACPGGRVFVCVPGDAERQEGALAELRSATGQEWRHEVGRHFEPTTGTLENPGRTTASR